MGSFGTLFFLYTKLSRQDVLLSIDQELLRVVESPTRWVAPSPDDFGLQGCQTWHARAPSALSSSLLPPPKYRRRIILAE
jgi:hypothetical protein